MKRHIIKRTTWIVLLMAVLMIVSSVMSFADEGDLKLISSYPKDGQTRTSIENLGVKLHFSNKMDSEEAVKANASKFRIIDEENNAVPVSVLFQGNMVLVVAQSDNGFIAKNNSYYKLEIDEDVVDNDGNTLGAAQTVTFKTYNQKVNNMVNMGMMFVMFGGIMFFSLRQNNKKEEETKKDEPKEAFNPYREAKRTGRTVEEVIAEHEKKEAKAAKKKAAKSKPAEESEKKIENCAELLTNVYHVHAPAPTNKADRSIDALRSMRKAEARAAKAEARAEQAAREARNRKKK